MYEIVGSFLGMHVVSILFTVEMVLFVEKNVYRLRSCVVCVCCFWGEVRLIISH